jgi:hypothetical protein
VLTNQRGLGSSEVISTKVTTLGRLLTFLVIM